MILKQLHHYYILCKPRVVLLMLLTVWAGMYLATSQPIPISLWITATLGIALMSSSAAAINHVIDHRVDALMARTKNRPLAAKKMRLREALMFAMVVGTTGFFILYQYVNHLTAMLTFASAIGYALIYSLYLKRATSQNIVIGGLSGAMPPLLGWTAVANRLDAEGWLLVAIIFTWTPAHFWALCLHRLKEYKETEIPMLPITHGIPFTKLSILLYSLLTIVCSLLPYAIHMSGEFYLIAVIFLDLGLIAYAIKLQVSQEPNIAIKTFRYSLIYLTSLFMVLLLDHYLILN